MTVTRRLVLALATILPLTVLTAAPVRADGDGGAVTIGVTIPSTAGVSCTRDGATLPKNPTVHYGDRLHCTATGFDANEQVAIALGSPASALVTATADSSGRVVYEYTVANDLAAGTHSLTFTGQKSATVAVYPFVVPAGQSSAAGGGGGTGGGGGSSGGIALTGMNFLLLLAAALALIGAGITLHRRGLQREHS